MVNRNIEMEGCNRLVVVVSLALCARSFDMEANFHVGFFHDGDIIVAQDAVFKQGHPFNRVKAAYGRVFPCIISYYGVIDKTQDEAVATVTTVRGGLGQNFVNLVMAAPVGKPISVVVFVGCHNVRKNEAANKGHLPFSGNIAHDDDWTYPSTWEPYDYI